MLGRHAAVTGREGRSFRLAEDQPCNQPIANLRSAAMSMQRLHPRFAETRLVEALADTPVVFIHGPRQCGKTTLARIAGDPRGYAYFSFHDPAALAAAKADPKGSSRNFRRERSSTKCSGCPSYLAPSSWPSIATAHPA